MGKVPYGKKNIDNDCAFDKYNFEISEQKIVGKFMLTAFFLHHLKKHPLISCQIVMKENPRKRPREPPNSATKEVKG